jgi:hypothetical protein
MAHVVLWDVSRRIIYAKATLDFLLWKALDPFSATSAVALHHPNFIHIDGAHSQYAIN